MSKKSMTMEDIVEKAKVPKEEQPYEIPNNWMWLKLDYVKKGKEGFGDGDWILSENLDPKGEVRLIQLSDIGQGQFLDKSSRYISANTFEELGCEEIFPGDILISRMAHPIARSCIVPELKQKLITAVDVAFLRPNEELFDTKYLNYMFNTIFFRKEAERVARGTTRLRITRKNLGNLAVPFPPLNEQKRIVEKTERLLEKIEKAKTLIEKDKETYEIRRAAILDKAFRGELGTNHIYEKSEIDLIGKEKVLSENEQPFDVPKNWVWINIKHVLDSMKTRDPKKIDGDTFYYIDVDAVNNKNQTLGNIKEVPIKAAPSRAKRMVNKGDVIISLVRPYLKNIALISNENPKLVASTAFYVCTTSASVTSKYLYYFLGSPFATYYLIKNTKGDNSPSVRKTDFESMEIPIPPLSEQKRITDKLESMMSKLESEQLVNETLLNNIDILSQSLFSKAFRGELGTNDPSDERSIDLLKRVLQ